MEKPGKPCKGLMDLNRANDWHLCLCLTLLKALVGEGIIAEEKINHYLKESVKEVIEAKMKLAMGSKDISEDENLVKFVKFH